MCSVVIVTERDTSAFWIKKKKADVKKVGKQQGQRDKTKQNYDKK